MGGVNLCPCCGGKVDQELFLADLNTNTVSFRGKAMRASPQVVELLFILARKRPATARTQELIQGLIGFRDVKNAENNLRVLVAHARQVGAAMGFKIDRVRMIGYRLVLSANKTLRISA